MEGISMMVLTNTMCFGILGTFSVLLTVVVVV